MDNEKEVDAKSGRYGISNQKLRISINLLLGVRVLHRFHKPTKLP